MQRARTVRKVGHVLSKLRTALAAAGIFLVAVIGGVALAPDAASGSGGADSAGPKWGGKNGVKVVVYDATLTQGLADAVITAIGSWNQSPVVSLTVSRVPGDCRDRNGAIVICEGEDCSGYWALVSTKGRNHISKVRINLMAGCGEWAFRDAESRINGACHELGHGLGLFHRDLTSPTCMAHNGSLQPDEVDYETLLQMYAK